MTPATLRRAARRLVHDAAQLLPYLEPVGVETTAALVGLVYHVGNIYGAAARHAEAGEASEARPTHQGAAAKAAETAHALMLECRAAVNLLKDFAIADLAGCRELAARTRELAGIARRLFGQYDMRAARLPTRSRGGR